MRIVTQRRNYGPFWVVSKAIRAELKFGLASLRCEIQSGITPLGWVYRSLPGWWVKFDDSPCAMGPFSAEALRKSYAKAGGAA